MSKLAATIRPYAGRSDAHGLAVHLPGRYSLELVRTVEHVIRAVQGSKRGPGFHYGSRCATAANEVRAYVTVTRDAREAHVRYNAAALVAAEALRRRGYAVTLHFPNGGYVRMPPVQ